MATVGRSKLSTDIVNTKVIKSVNCKNSNNCYIAGCRNECCKLKHREHNKLAYRKYSRPDSDWQSVRVDSKEAQKHLLWLRKQGIGCKQIAKQCGILSTIVINIRNGNKKYIYRKTHNKIMSLNLTMFANRSINKITAMEQEWQKGTYEHLRK